MGLDSILPDTINRPFQHIFRTKLDEEYSVIEHPYFIAVQVFEGTWREQKAIFKTRDVSEEDAGVISTAKLSALNHLAEHKVSLEIATSQSQPERLPVILIVKCLKSR